jgi:hypothetical protein
VKFRIISALVVAGLISVFGVAPAAQAATPPVMITKIQYDSPGTDTGSNTSLNAEWVRITNTRTYTINLKGWTLRDRTGYTYRFPTTTNYYIGAGGKRYIHTGKGTNGQPDYQHRYWQRSWYVWNNTGDTATLRNAAGTYIDSCSWSTRGLGYTLC